MKPHITTRAGNIEVQQDLQAAGISPLLAQLYAARDIESVAETSHDLAHLLHFRDLKHINAAALQLAAAIDAGKRLLIIADYDADGATACAVAMKGLGLFGAKVDFLVPNRFEHGYGLTPLIVDEAAAVGAELNITVDNGIASLAGVAHAQALGIEVLVTDHHLPADTLPACTIVNPNQPDCGFGSKNLAGCGVMFYVLLALRAHYKLTGRYDTQAAPNLGVLLDYVALGTVADVVKLDHNNRILVAQGLKRMRAGKAALGIQALFEIAKRDIRKAEPFDLGFAIGPRINAAGRLDDMSIGIRCLLADNELTAQTLAAELDSLNRERRGIEQSMLKEALNLPEFQVSDSQMTVTAYRDDWHQGVIGIVAGRLRERYFRPTIVFAPGDDGELRGSGRSIPALHLRDTLDLVSKRHPHLISKFGGHAMAAGLSLPEAALPEFQAAFEQAVNEQLHRDDLTQTYVTDGELSGDALCLQAAQQLREVVWGQGFAPPMFVGEFEVTWQRAVGVNHKKAGIRKTGSAEVEAMFFRCEEDLPERIRMVYRMVANEWRGQYELQLHSEYWEAV